MLYNVINWINAFDFDTLGEQTNWISLCHVPLKHGTNFKTRSS